MTRRGFLQAFLATASAVALPTVAFTWLEKNTTQATIEEATQYMNMSEMNQALYDYYAPLMEKLIKADCPFMKLIDKKYTTVQPPKHLTVKFMRYNNG